MAEKRPSRSCPAGSSAEEQKEEEEEEEEEKRRLNEEQQPLRLVRLSDMKSHRLNSQPSQPQCHLKVAPSSSSLLLILISRLL